MTEAQGQELTSVNAYQVSTVVGRFVQEGAKSIAVCLLHSYASAAHERQVRDIIAAAFPSVDITLSSDVAPVARAYERISTTVANAYIKPLANQYLHQLEVRLAELSLPSGVLMMLSNGGLTPKIGRESCRERVCQSV